MRVEEDFGINLTERERFTYSQ